jgi:hypothetical protein
MEGGKVIELKPQTATTELESEEPIPTAKEIAEMRRKRAEYVRLMKDDFELLKLETDILELRLRKLMMIEKFKELQKHNAHTNITTPVLSPEGTDTAGTAATEQTKE